MLTNNGNIIYAVGVNFLAPFQPLEHLSRSVKHYNYKDHFFTMSTVRKLWYPCTTIWPFLTKKYIFSCVCSSSIEIIKSLGYKIMQNLSREGVQIHTASMKNVRVENKVPGLPWWRSGWESACQCRGHGFEPWSRRIPHAAEQLSPCATATEPVLWSPRATTTEPACHSYWSLRA